ncbi:hypothetical protein Tco_0886345 [Tanacetum coccineum]
MLLRPQACWVWKLKTKVLDHVSKHNSASTILKRAIYKWNYFCQGVIDSGCSRHMTGNMSYLTDFEEINRGFVAFGAFGFMRPFRCPVTILNIIDHLGKFDGKTDEGFFVGYNKQCVDESSSDAGFKPSRDNEKKVTEEPRKEGSDSNNDQEKEDDNVNITNNVNTASDGNNTNNVNAVSSTVNAAGIKVNAVGAKTSIELPNDPNMLELEDIVFRSTMKCWCLQKAMA